MLLSVCASLIYSCEKSENDITEKEQNINLSKISSLKSMSGEQQKITYRLLNESEKLKLWNDRFTSILEKEKLDIQQKNAIQDLIEIINLDFFDTNSTDKNITSKEIVKGWIMENESKFKKIQFVNYFASLKSMNSNYQSRNGDGAGDLDDNCECNELEDYCIGISFECKKSKKCDSTYSGCGFLWNSKCNGECEQK